METGFLALSVVELSDRTPQTEFYDFKERTQSEQLETSTRKRRPEASFFYAKQYYEK